MTKILVIEDDADLRDNVVEWLTLEGFEVSGAVDGVDGVNCTLRDQPDLIICDIMMPRLDGYGVMLDVRANSLTRLTPFIFMTAKATHEDIRQGMISGADDYITKPFTHDELLNAIKTRLDKQIALTEEQQRLVYEWRRALKQEREQQMVRARLITMFSRDLRDPLSSLMSSIRLVRDFSDRMDDVRRLSHFDYMEASVHQLMQMLDDLLVVAQMETGTLQLNARALNLDDFIQGIVDEFQTPNTSSHRIRYESYRSGTVKADPRLLRQIATNLVSNAVTYSPQGGDIYVTLDHGEREYILRVQDQGIGIPVSDQSRVFEPFRRGSNVGSIDGIGLGLTIVSQAVDLYGGSIALASEVGTGTAVTVAFPVL